MCWRKECWERNRQANQKGTISDLRKAISNLKIKKEVSDPKDGEGDKEKGEDREECGSEEEEKSEGEKRKENKTKKRKRKMNMKKQLMAKDGEMWRKWVPGTCPKR